MNILNKIKLFLGIPVKISVIDESPAREIAINITCPLCEESPEWPFPSDRHKNGYHFKLGLHWKPEKGHPDYEYHLSGNYHFSGIKK